MSDKSIRFSVLGAALLMGVLFVGKGVYDRAQAQRALSVDATSGSMVGTSTVVTTASTATTTGKR